MFTLALPWILILLPLPLLIWLLLPRVKLHLPYALKIPFFQQLAARVTDKPIKARGRPFFWLIIWSLLDLAAAGPKWVGEPEPLERQGRNIMLVLDISGSMELPDMMLANRPASRLAVVKQAALDFVRQRERDHLGLILFGTRAYLQTPLTYDKEAVSDRILDATVGLAGQTTSIGDALGLAVKRLQNTPTQGRVIILLTDGVNNSGILSPLKAAELAKQDNIKVYTIGLGAESLPRGLDDIFASESELDEKTLQQLAKVTNGQYFRATDSASLNTIYQTINQLEEAKQDSIVIRLQKDYYSWPLGLAFLLFFYWLSQLGARFSFRAFHND